MAIHIDSSVLGRLEKVDPDRIRAARLADVNARQDLFALYAFHAELAKVPELVSEPMMGQIRYQWWRDAVEEIYAGGAVRAHEVTTPLTDMVRRTNLPRYYLDQLIDGRERDLDPRPFTDLTEASEYARQTSGALMSAACAALGQAPDPASSLGLAWGLAGLARSYRFYHDRMLQNLDQAELADAAMAALNAGPAKLSADVMPACAYAALVPLFTKAIMKPGRDPKTDPVTLSPLRKQVRLFRAAATGRVR